MKQNLFCTAANETKEICERDNWQCVFFAVTTAFFALLSVSVPPLFSPRAAAQSKGLLISLSLSIRVAVDRSQLITYRQN